MAVKRNDKGEFWLLYKVNISNLHILGITFKANSENRANVRIPITSEGIMNLCIGLLIGVVDFAINLMNELLSLVMHYKVNCPLLGVQSQAWRLCRRARTPCQDKMFQLWKLVLLCGLLAGTSASLLDIRGNDVLRKLKSGLERGLDTFDSTLETIFQNLKTELESRCSDEVVEETQETENLLEQLISRIFQVVYSLTGVRIRNVQVPDITFEATSDHSADVKIPIAADVTVNLPLLGEIVNLDLNVDIHTTVTIETDTDTETSDSKVVVGECTNNPESISLTVLHRRFGLLNSVVDIGVNLARSVVSSVVQDELCPRFRELLESLDAECVKKLIGEPQDTQVETGQGR
ncbi:hypothetical protein CapIbe_011748 [Capra ibex]